VTTFHRYLGTIIVLLFVALMLWGLILRAVGRTETPNAMWGAQHWTENLLVVQTVFGIVLLIMGRRVVTADPLAWLHYLYGSLFPLVAVVGGRLAAIRRETREYVGLAWGAFFAFALTLRAIQTACGDAISEVIRCMTP
jgi:di/tricarboxylate transporter